MSDCPVVERQEKGTCTLSKKHARTLRKGTLSPHDISTFSRSFSKYQKRKRKMPFLGIQYRYICAVCGLPLRRPAGKRVDHGEKGTQLAFRLSSPTVGPEHVHGNISIGPKPLSPLSESTSREIVSGVHLLTFHSHPSIVPHPSFPSSRSLMPHKGPRSGFVSKCWVTFFPFSSVGFMN